MKALDNRFYVKFIKLEIGLSGGQFAIDSCYSLLKVLHTFLITLLKGCINEIENSKIA